MKQSICALVFSLILLQTLPAQDTILRKQIYKIALLDQSGNMHPGYLRKISDSSLLISKEKIPIQSDFRSRQPVQSFAYSDMQTVKIKRAGSIGRGILYGSLIGGLVGFVAGVAQGSDPDHIVESNWLFGSYTVYGTTAFEKGGAGGFAGALCGGLVGGIIGAFTHKTFIIEGKRKQFADMHMSMLERIYTTAGHDR